MARHIFLTPTSVVSRKLARSLVAIRLQRRLAARPSVDVLVQRSVLPGECVPIPASHREKAGSRSRKTPSPASYGGRSEQVELRHGIVVAPALVARRREVERERVKDSLRRWVGSVWGGEVRSRSESVRRREERAGVGRVWRLRRFWERVNEGGAPTSP